MKRRDPIVEEVRRNREAVARERGNDVGAISAAFQGADAASGIITASFTPKRLVSEGAGREANGDRWAEDSGRGGSGAGERSPLHGGAAHHFFSAAEGSAPSWAAWVWDPSRNEGEQGLSSRML